MKDRILKKIAYFAYRHNVKVLISFFILVVLAVIPLSRLELSMKWSDLLPEKEPSVKEYNSILKEYSSATTLILALKGPKNKIIELGDIISEKLKKANNPLIKRIDGEINREFYIKNSLKLMKTNDLENSQELFYSPRILSFLQSLNHSLEKTYIFSDDEERLSNREKKDNAINMMDFIQDFITILDSKNDYHQSFFEKTLVKFFSGEKYFMSYSEDMLIINIIPTFSVTETDKASELIHWVRDIMLKEIGDDNDVKGGLTGFLAMGSDELDTMDNMNIITLITFLLIIFVFIAAFRIWISPILAGIILIVSVIFSGASAYIFYGSLNIITSMFAVILFGLIIDFSIHIISHFQESMNHGSDLLSALEETLVKSGGGILIGGITTSLCFSVLLLTENRGMKEFGGVVGSGVLIGIAVTLFLLPALLKTYYSRYKMTKKRKIEFQSLEYAAVWMTKKKIFTLICLVILIFVFILFPGKISFDYNVLNIEPPNMESVVWFYDIVNEYDLSTDQAMVSIPAGNMDKIRKIVNQAKDYSSIAITESITEYIPSEEKYNNNIKMIEEIKRQYLKNRNNIIYTLEDSDLFLSILDTLWMNVTEMGALAFQKGQERLETKCYEITKNPENTESKDYFLSIIENYRKHPESLILRMNQIQKDFFPSYSNLLDKALNTEKITLDNLPENIRSRFISNSGKEVLVSFYSQDNVWDFNKLKNFRQVLNKLDKNITGTPVMFLDLIQLMGKDGKFVILFSVFFIFIILLIDFRSIITVLAAMVPLFLSLIGLMFFMKIMAIKIDIINIIALPLILGIGIDDGVHFVHRYLAEGKNIAAAYRSTGKAALITTITTIIGFGSLCFIPHRGMAKMGLLLVVGIGLCWVMTVVFLAPFLAFFKKR